MSVPPRLIPAALLALGVLLLALCPSSVPPLWFDEGWILTVARNWVETGYYGELPEGKPKPAAMLNVGFPVIAAVAGSFRLFGVGIWQGRLPGMLFALGSLILMYLLAVRMYSREAGTSTVLVLLLMPGLSPILMGKQALGEMPAIFFLLSGLAFLIAAWHRPVLSVPLVSIMWGLAGSAKRQVMPFLFLALGLTLLTALRSKQWRSLRQLASLTVGTLITFAVFLSLQEKFVGGGVLTEPGLYSGTAVVLVPVVRAVAAERTLMFGLPVLIGMLYEGRRVFRYQNPSVGLDAGVAAGRLILWTLAAAWLTWYVMLSIDWHRYLFPALFLGSVFPALLIHKRCFGNRATILRGDVNSRRTLRLKPRIVFVLVVFNMAMNLDIMARAFFMERDRSVEDVAAFLNTRTPQNVLIETYDMELIFLLNRRYHYPPDHVQLQLNRRKFIREAIPVQYDPLQADPDYLVVGPHSSLWRLYDSALQTGQFEMIRSYNRYKVYRRIR